MAAPVGEKTETVEVVSKEKFLKHVKSMTGLQGKIAELRGDLGQVVKDAEDKNNIHRGAAKLAAKFDRMDQTKREEYLFHLALYLDYLGVGFGQDMFRKGAKAAEAPKNVTQMKPAGHAVA